MWQTLQVMFGKPISETMTKVISKSMQIVEYLHGKSGCTYSIYKQVSAWFRRTLSSTLLTSSCLCNNSTPFVLFLP